VWLYTQFILQPVWFRPDQSTVTEQFKNIKIRPLNGFSFFKGLFGRQAKAKTTENIATLPCPDFFPTLGQCQLYQ
jgi:hypothetical protein